MRNAVMFHLCFAIFWILGFILTRSALLKWLGEIHDLAQYGFDLLYCVATFVIFSQSTFQFRFKQTRTHWAWVSVMLLAGFAVASIARIASIPIPWDLSDPSLLMLLLGVAPVLEELLFRGALWRVFIEIEERTHYFQTRKKRLATIGTSVLFALAHFEMLFHVPAEIRPFIFYQTAYTLIMALALAHVFRQEASLLLMILMHFAFNFGFGLGAIL